MVHDHVVNLVYKIKYETETPVPLEDVINALSSLTTLLSSSSAVISEISQIEIQGHQLYVQRLESGSLIEDIVVSLIFHDKERMNEFLQWLHKTNMREWLVGAIIGGALVYGVNVLQSNNAAPGNNSGSQIVNSPNAMIINFPEGALSDEMQEKLTEEIGKRVGNKDEYAKQTLSFFEPARGDSKATIAFGEGNATARIPTQIIQNVPKKYKAKKNNRFEDLNGVQVELRATDLDNKKTGWAGAIKDVTPRIRLELDPTIDPVEIYGKTKLVADVTLERDFSTKANQMVPKRMIIRKIY